MRLKTVTTGLLIFGVLLLCGLPFLLRVQPPETAPYAERARYALMFGGYTVLIFGVAISVIVCALVVLRRTTKELQEQARQNMQIFVEGTLSEHGARKGAALEKGGAQGLNLGDVENRDKDDGDFGAERG